MSSKNVASFSVRFLLCLVLMFTLISDSSNFSDFENLSYGRDVLYGGAPPYTPPSTQPPIIEVTTKKSGFFSGIKNFFVKTTTEIPVEVSTIGIPISTPKASIPVQPPLSPKTQNPGNLPTGSTSTPITSRDYVNPNVKPGTNPVRPPEATNLASNIPQLPTSKRDYVNPIVGPSVPVHPPIANPGPAIQPGGSGSNTFNPTSTSTVIPSNRRDYVAPIRPVLPGQTGGSSNNNYQGSISTPTNLPTQPNSRRDYINPNVPTPKPPMQNNYPNTPVTPQSPNSGGSNRRDYVNPNIGGQRNPLNPNEYPALPTPKKPLIKEDFPALPPPRKPSGGPSTNLPLVPTPNSVWSKPGGVGRPTEPSSVSFIPHQPGPTSGSAGGGDSKNQLASDDEIHSLTETLLSKDTNNQNKHIRLNLQGKTRSTDRTDEAPNKLMEIDEVAFQTPTIAKMRLLFNNYELDTMVNEYVTPNERKEENDFLDAVMATQVMRQTMQFLQSKGLVTPDPKTHRDLIKTIWFTLYSRGQGRIGSSAFEHVFLTEVKNGTVIGLHNWVYYNDEEKAGHIDYKGYIKKIDLGTKGTILKYRFDLNGIQKPVNTLFVGTSPELEIALYTVCFELRSDKDCSISLNGNKLNIVTHSWRYRGKTLIGSAFPEI